MEADSPTLSPDVLLAQIEAILAARRFSNVLAENELRAVLDLLAKRSAVAP